MTIGDRIRTRRKELKITQDELAEKTKTTKQTIYKYEQNIITNIPTDRIEKLANVLDVTPQWLMGWNGYEEAAELIGMAKKNGIDLSDMLKLTMVSDLEPPEDLKTQTARRLAPAELVNISMHLNESGNADLIRYGHYLETNDAYKITEKERRFRLVQSPRMIEEPASIIQIRHYLTPAAAGYASPIEGEDYEMMDLPADAPLGADFCIDISGDSMEPYIKNGSTVYVKRDVSLRQFDPGIFFYAGDVYCKQICEDYAGINLLSANPKREDANIHISKDNLSYLVCFGKVLIKEKLPEPNYRRSN
jgi:phage repressor protein C with HTH and peptisase S24 domain/DNA-binding XRE family transcriptional regulator